MITYPNLFARVLKFRYSFYQSLNYFFRNFQFSTNTNKGCEGHSFKKDERVKDLLDECMFNAYLLGFSFKSLEIWHADGLYNI